MLKLDKNTLNYFQKRNAKQIKIFFYDAGCSGTKVNITDDFEIDVSVEKIMFLHFGTEDSEEEGMNIFVDKREKEKFENCSITRVVTADHTGKEKVRYIYSADGVKGRCGCGSSFSFGEEKKVKLDLGKLRDLKNNFKK